MKRKMTFSLTLTLTLLLSLVSLPATSQAAPPQRFSARSGVVTPGMGQMLRVTVVPTGNDTIGVRFRWMQYMAQGCSGMPPVCRHMVANQGTTPVETLTPDDAESFDAQANGAAVQVVVESNSKNARVTFQIIDAATGKVVCAWTDDNGSPSEFI